MPNDKYRKLIDTELISLISEGAKDRKTIFQELIHRHRSDLQNRCHALLGNPHDAEEAVQETVIRAYLALPGYKGDAAFRTWLFAIGDNQCFTLMAKRKRFLLSDHLRELILLCDEIKQSPPLSPEGRTEQVHQVMSELPQSARDVLMLRFFGDLSLKQIADTQGIGLSAAKMRLHRAMDLFAAIYQDEPERLAA